MRARGVRVTREPPNRYSPPCVLRVAGGPPPSPPGRSRLEPGDGDTSCQGPSQPKPCLSGIFKGEPDPAVTNSPPPPQTVPPPGVSAWGHVAPTSAVGGLRMGGSFHPRFLERLEGEWGESSDRCLWPRAATLAVTGAHSRWWGRWGGAPPTTGVLGVVLTLIAPRPERGQLRPRDHAVSSVVQEEGAGRSLGTGSRGVICPVGWPCW